jgi:hypothetical protein
MLQLAQLEQLQLRNERLKAKLASLGSRKPWYTGADDDRSNDTSAPEPEGQRAMRLAIAQFLNNESPGKAVSELFDGAQQTEAAARSKVSRENPAL